jgi:peptidoglycan hydrolase-like protein with peptidoglycan-binding domain
MSTMRPWRVLKQGMQSQDDVEAAQRGLWRLLDAASTNARNGTFGEQTVADVGRARTLLKLAGPSTEIGAELWRALQISFDGSAYALASNKPPGIAAPSPHCRRLPLSRGMKGHDVKAAQLALTAALGPKDSLNAQNGVYGDQTVHDVKLFRTRFVVNKNDSGATLGQEVWDVLTRWMDQRAIDEANSQPPPPRPVAPAQWDVVGDEAWWAFRNRGRFLYAQLRPMPMLHAPPTVHTDCSGLYTACCQSAGVPNPNRSDGVYDGYGWTGTLCARGRWTQTPRRGDAALYGSGPPYQHVAVYLGDGTVISFGKDPIQHLPARYWNAFAGFRTYH